MNGTDVENLIRILLVEDDPHDRRAFHRALRNSELLVQVTDCKRAEDALELLASDAAQYDVIVSDHNLLGASGLELYQQLRNRQIGLPFILLTGVGNELLAVKALKLGVDDYLSKNAGQAFTEELPTAIARVVRIHRDREKDRRKDEFLATLAHELRNPLAPMRTALEILRSGTKEEGLVEKAVAAMDRQVHHMSRLVDDLLDLSRVMRGKITLRKEVVSLDDILQRALETSRPVIEARHHELIVNLPEEEVWLEADEVRIAQVLANLLNNAAKYTDQGGHVWLRCDVETSELTIRVRDDGIGMEPQEQSHVFELFQQVEGSLERSCGGLGIGLTLVRRLAEMHGGSVSACSDGLGKGCEFLVRLPVLQGRHGKEATPVRRRKIAVGQRRILVVDDNLDAAEMLAALLRLESHEVVVACDGPSALDQAIEFSPDVILLDIGLPGMNGYEVARWFRQQERFDKTLIVAVTGFGQETDREGTSRAGFDYHFVKPVDPQEIREVLTASRTSPRDGHALS